jgi:putative oxidoreductase
MNKIFNQQALNTDVAALILRLIFGGLFMHFGYAKLAGFTEMLSIFPNPIHIGVKPTLILVIFAELFCGFLVTIGFLTRLSIIPIFIVMIVVVFIVHAKDPFDIKTLPFLFMFLSLVIFVLGSGKFSVDNLIFKKRINRRID